MGLDLYFANGQGGLARTDEFLKELQYFQSTLRQ